MARVFISYAREDGREFAERLSAELQGHDAWLDRSELAPGVQWNAEIESAIDGSDVFLPVLTRRYLAARFAPLELARAFRHSKPLIPLRVHADADLSIFLETTQWIDFSDAAAYANGLAALRAQIDVIAGGGRPAPRDLREGMWDALQTRAARQSRRVLGEIFRPDLYVPREAERQLAQFLASPAPALLVVGDSGVGKSSLLAHWALALLAEGHAVLTYDCSALPGVDVEEEIARDLGLPENTAVEDLGAAAARAGRQLVLVFDSLGDFRGSEANAAQTLLKRLHALAGRVPGEHVRIVVSCNAGAWSRIERSSRLRFDSRYFRAADEPFLRLGPFTGAERDEAYRRYRAAFDLFSDLEELPQAVRERLRDPLLLRMTAEVHRGVRQPLLPVNLGTRIYRTFFEERVTTPAEELLVDELAREMLNVRSSALPMMDLARHELLGREVLTEDPLSTYAQLLDRGVLQEARGDPRAGIIVRFAHTRLAAYAMARHVLRGAQNVTRSAEELLAQAPRFPLAREAAKTLLLLAGDDAAITTLATSRGLDQRELAAETLIELHAENPDRACALLEALLDQDSNEGRRTALKAAYHIGPRARDFFIRAACDGAPAMRESVRNTLYLIWRNESPAGRRSVTDTFYLLWVQAPGFTYGLLESLLDEIRFRNLTRVRSIIEFFLDLTITIYINHCEDPVVIDRTASLMHELTVNRLHLDKLTLGKTVETLVVRAFTRIFGAQILDWMLFAGDVPAQEFFRLPAERRAWLSRIAATLDPASDLAAVRADLAAMLGDDLPIFRGSAALAIAVHAAHDPAGTKPVVEHLWNNVGRASARPEEDTARASARPEEDTARASARPEEEEDAARGRAEARPDIATERLWILAAFAVLLESTPREWTALLEDLTSHYLAEHRDEFLGPAGRLTGDLDIALLPLGLAYGKSGSSMPLFETILGNALAEDDPAMAARVLAALAATGFYYPDALLDVIRPALARLADPQIASALVMTLATMRTLHIDAVDRFLADMPASEEFRHRVTAAADVALVHRYIRVLGYYNNAVHFTLRYPRMRRTLSAGALELLATSPTPYAFVADYTLAAMRMLRESRFQLKEWTLPE